MNGYVCHDLLMLLCSGILRKELFSVADPPWAPLFLDQTEAQRVEKYFLDTTTPPPPTYLKIWIWH